MHWIRISVTIGDDPDIYTLAHHLGIRPAEAVGLLVMTLVKFPAHAPDGNLKDIPDALIERWAGWTGEPGQYAGLMRALFLNESGIWESWERHNGQPLREAEASRERARKYREQKLNTEASTANGTAYGTANERERFAFGTGLRTNVRTNQTTRGATHRNVENYAPGHVNLMPTKFCAECGDGVLVEVAGSKRPVQSHAPGCGNA